MSGVEAEIRKGLPANTSLETSCLSQKVRMLYALLIARYHYLNIQTNTKVSEI
jgi:hypothetical protein